MNDELAKIAEASLAAREDVRMALSKFEALVLDTVNQAPTNVGRDHALASLTQIRSAKRVLWMED